MDAKPAGGSKIMAQEQISKSYNTDNRERFGTTDPLGGFIAEVESGAGLQAPDAAAVRYERLCTEAQLDIDKEVPPPPVAIYIGDSPACTFGNFSASIGKPKGKKTFNVSAMTAAAMTNSTILNYRGNMPSDQNGILYFDTEQSKYHAFRVFKRIARLTHRSNAEIKQRIKYYALRKYSVEDRIGMIDHKIRNTPAVGLVIIDGIRDLMLDINNPREATLIVNYLMKWTEEYNLHIHTIIHQNKSDENARGHIGTEINNKSETVLRVEKDKNDDAISTVEAVYIRDVSFPSFAFRINDEALPELIKDYVPTPESKGNEAWDPYHDISEDTHRSALDSAFPNPDTLLRHGELMDALREAYADEDIELSDYKLKILITFLKNKRMIEQVDKGKKKGNPYRYLQDFYY